SIPEGSKINSASLRIYQYMNYSSNTQFACYRIEDSWSSSTLNWDKAVKLNQSPSGENAVSQSAVGFHNFDCRETVNNWVQGIQENYGFVVQATDETRTGSPFFTPLSAAGNPGQEAFTLDKAPQLIIDWEVPNPVDPNYPLDETTINLRTIIETNKDGLLRFHAIFADGVAQPGAAVSYKLNDSSKNQNGIVAASPSYKYPDSLEWSKYFPARATKYKDIQSNWQTIVPFTDTTFNTIYQYSATAEKDGIKGNTAKSDEFLVYKIKQYDTLPKIANYYGVPLAQIMFDNRVQDMLLIENNTIVIINPTKNGNRPYNPEPLTDADKRKIDALLMGRGKHCEFGFEPINLNTGNFYFNTEDISIPDLNGNFNIERTYNSKGAGYNSSFGRGWHFEYDEYISKLENGTYVYSRGDGSAIYFEPNGKGGYTCPDGYNLTFTPVKIGEKEGDFGGEELEKYNVYEYEVKSADGEVRRFNTMGMLTKITDSKGFVTSLAYDDEYNLKSITSPAGTVYSFSYTEDGYIKAITLPNGKVLAYAYDDNNNLVSYKDANGNEIKYAYDSKHQMTSWTDAEGNVIVTNTYDNEGRVTKQVDANGAVSTLAYANGKTTTTDANGNVTVYHYDNQYRTTKIEYPNGSTELKTYDNSNNLASVTDRNGNKTEYTYNNDGYVLSEERFDGAVKKYEYNSDNQITKVTDYDGKTTSYEYSNKDVVKQINNDGTALTYAYDNKHRMTKSTDAMGNASEYTYSGAFLSSLKNADGKTSKYAYNSLGQIVSITDANGEITRFTYDNAGRKLTQQTADGAITKYVYDKAGCVISITDPKNNAFTFTYDGLGNILTATDPYGKTITYTYDGNGNKISETDAEGNKTVYTYDSMNNLVSATDADGNKTTYAYDKDGNQISSTDANGNTSNVEYDYRFNQVSKVTNGAGEALSYTYDVVGNITKITYPNGSSISTSYDNMNRLAKTVSPSGLETTYTYDANGNAVTVADNTDRTCIIGNSYSIAVCIIGIG
ncbi:MAG: DNRLRE domain-containing protein, partial [Eubacterium sp.]|nr:DNRLRE domain-containing protein [Eubacterium sp.]